MAVARNTKLIEARERLDARRAARAARKLGLKVKEPGAKAVTKNAHQKVGFGVRRLVALAV